MKRLVWLEKYGVHSAKTSCGLIRLSIAWVDRSYRLSVNGERSGVGVPDLEEAKRRAITISRSLLYRAARQLGAPEFVWPED